MSAELPLVARAPELAVLKGIVDAATAGKGATALITGEAGIGKTRLLSETRQLAELQGLFVLRGRAVESGGAYRPLVEAFARPSVPFSQDPRLAAARPTLARVFPGWTVDAAVLAPMADPAAVLAEALIAVLQVVAPDGAVLILDDLQWADEDTLSVLTDLPGRRGDGSATRSGVGITSGTASATAAGAAGRRPVGPPTAVETPHDTRGF